MKKTPTLCLANMNEVSKHVLSNERTRPLCQSFGCLDGFGRRRYLFFCAESSVSHGGVLAAPDETGCQPRQVPNEGVTVMQQQC